MSRVGVVIKPPFDPRQMAGLATDCRSYLGVTLNGGAVSAVQDQSPNKLAYAQATAVNQFTYVPNVLNGKPVFRGATANQWLSVASIPGVFGAASLAFACVVKPNTWGGQYWTQWANGVIGSWSVGSTASALRASVQSGASGAGVSANLDVTPGGFLTNWHFLLVNYDGASLSVYVDSATPSGSTAKTGAIESNVVAVNAGGRNNQGGSLALDGDMAAWWLWTHGLSGGEIAEMRGFSKSTFGV